MLAKYYEGWTHEDIERLTPRQARGYYNRIPEVEKMLYDGDDGNTDGAKKQSWDLDKIFKEANELNIPTPKR